MAHDAPRLPETKQRCTMMLARIGWLFAWAAAPPRCTAAHRYMRREKMPANTQTSTSRWIAWMELSRRRFCSARCVLLLFAATFPARSVLTPSEVPRCMSLWGCECFLTRICEGEPRRNDGC